LGENDGLALMHFKEISLGFSFSESITPKTEWFQRTWHDDLRDLGMLNRYWCRIRGRYLYNAITTFYSDLTSSIIAILAHRRFDGENSRASFTMTTTRPKLQDSSWSSIIRDPAISRLLVNMAFSGLSYGVYSNLVMFFFVYLDPIGWFGDFTMYYLVFQITISIALPVAGVLTDKIGRKAMLTLGSSIVSIGMFVLPISTEWWHLLYSSALQAIGFALLGTAQNCVVADVTKGYRREKGYSITMSFSMVFGVVGTIVLIIYSFLYEKLLPANIYYELPLLVAAILALIAAIPMFLIRIPRQPQENHFCNSRPEENAKSPSSNSSGTSRNDQSYTPPSSIWRNGVVLKMIAFQGIIGFGAGFLVPIFNYYWKDIFHLDQYMIYTIALLGELGTVVGGLTAPWVAKRVTRLGGRVGTTVACQFASIACAVYLAAVPFYLVLIPAVMAYIARMALMNMVNPLMSAMTMDHTPEAKRGRVNSLTQLAFNVPNGISPNLSDPLIHSVQLPYGYTYSALVLISTYITATAMLSTTRKKDRILVMQSRQEKQ
jgi:MFS family permease